MLSLRLVVPQNKARNGTIYSFFPFGIIIIDLELPGEKWEDLLYQFDDRTFLDFGVGGRINVFKR